jgi:ketosteroid isomerase-like protein
MSQPINSEQEASVKKFVDEWATAERQNDATALAGILENGYLGVGPRGFVLTKEDWLQRYKSGDLHNDAFNFDEAKIRLYGDTAVVIGRQIQKTKYQGQEVPGGEFRTTLVLVKQQGRWQLASLQLSPILGRP